jgi:hypothetical protein
MSKPLHTVHVRVNDAATGRPTPVRIRFTGPDGTNYPPFGRANDLSDALSSAGVPGQIYGGSLLIEDRAYAYVDGTCEIRLPAGVISVEISKGPEFQHIVQQAELSAGKLALRFSIERWIDLRKDGWYSGDVGVRYLVPHACLLEGAAEDVAVVNLLAFEGRDKEPRLFPNLLAFSGQKPALEMPGHMVVVNTENRHPVLGNLILLNCHRVVYPLHFGTRFDNWTLADWCDQCHRKGGLVVWKPNDTYGRDENFGEALADLILGKVDAIQIDPTPHGFNPWMYYVLLNSGLRVPVVAGGEKSTVDTQIGMVRTYAHLGHERLLNYQAWIEAIRAGRTYVTWASLLSFTVNEQGPGTVLDLDPLQPKVRVRAEARSRSSFGRLQVIANGQVAADTPCSGSPAAAVIETDLTMPLGGWLAARCITPEQMLATAHTSPVYARVSGRTPPIELHDVEYLRSGLKETLQWIEEEARFENGNQRQSLIGVLESAKQKLSERLS